MKIRPQDTQAVSQTRTATILAEQSTQTTQQTTRNEDAAKLSLRLVSQANAESSADKTARIKAQVQAGTYSVDSKEVAKKFAAELL